MNMNTPEHIVEELKDNLLDLGCDGGRDRLIIEKSIGICSCALWKLREYANQQDFKTREEDVS